MLRATQLVGFMGGAESDIAVTDEGGAGLSGGGSSTHTLAMTPAGPFVVVGFTWFDVNNLRSISSATWGGQPVTIEVQLGVNVIANRMGAAILSYNGVPTGNLVVNFSGSVDLSIGSVLSLRNVQNPTPIDPDSESSSSGAADLDSLTTPGAGGIRVAAYCNANNGTAITWSPGSVVEVADTDASLYRHGVAYELGDDGAAIAANADAGDEVIVGVSWR